MARARGHRFAARIYEDMGAIDLARSRRTCGRPRPGRRARVERLGRLRCACTIRQLQPTRCARSDASSERRGAARLALALALSGDLGGELSACEALRSSIPQSIDAWVRLAHALARTDRISDCLDACATALKLGAGAELLDLRDRMREARRRVLPAA